MTTSALGTVDNEQHKTNTKQRAFVNYELCKNEMKH